MVCAAIYPNYLSDDRERQVAGDGFKVARRTASKRGRWRRTSSTSTCPAGSNRAPTSRCFRYGSLNGNRLGYLLERQLSDFPTGRKQH